MEQSLDPVTDEFGIGQPEASSVLGHRLDLIKEYGRGSLDERSRAAATSVGAVVGADPSGWEGHFPDHESAPLMRAVVASGKLSHAVPEQGPLLSDAYGGLLNSGQFGSRFTQRRDDW